MKMSAFKFISIILCIAVSIVFSGATAYAAAAAPGVTVPFGSLSSEAQDIFRAGVERFIEDLFSYNNYDDKTYSYTSPDGTVTTYTKPDLISDTLSAISDYVEAVQDSDGITSYYVFTQSVDSLPYVILDEYCSLTHKSSEDGRHGGGGRIRIDASDYSESISNILKKTASDSLSIGLDIVNGVPQNVTTIKEDLYISVFDILGLQYTVAPSLLDYQFNIVTHKKSISYQNYTPFFITSDNKLYLFQAVIFTTARSSNNIIDYAFYSSSGHTNSFSINGLSSYNVRLSFRFVDNSNHLYFCLLSSCYNSSLNSISYTQQTNGRPGVSNAPLLFYDYRDGLDAPGSASLGTNFINNELPDGIGISFINSVDNSDVMTDSEILSADILAAGCFQAHQYTSSTLNSAGQMLLSSDNVVIGGDKTTTSDLSDWQKAIYVLAQQQGISFEELLTKMDLLIDSNGEITLLGLDGIEYSVSELSKKFDEIIGAVGDISGDLSKLLEYLKSLNLEGLEDYISSIEGTLNDLNERDKDNSAVLGDCLGTLQDLKEVMEGLSADVSSIANTITKIEAVELDISESINKLEPPSSITTKFPFSLPFDVYNIFNVLSADPVTPQFTIPFDFSSIGGEVYEINIDLSQFDYIASIVRWLLYGVFLIGLVLLTNKLIGRG